jgi:GNAT superfamily N-acetyltransferase
MPPQIRPYALTIDPAADPADLKVVTDGLRAFNIERIGDPGEVPVNVLLRDESGRIVGGLIGIIKWRWLYVAKLWVDESARGQKAGSRLMAAAEEFAKRHGATNAYLDTFGYQARPFYEKLGYTVFGTLEGFPPGSCQHFLTKVLVTGN